MKRLAIVVGLVAAILMLGAAPASAHPLGNFSVNRSSGLVVGTEGLSIDFVEDLAEIPTVQVSPSVDADGDRQLSPAELQSYAPRACAAVAAGMRLEVAGSRVPLSVRRASAGLRPGAAGLSTLLLKCGLHGGYSAVSEGSSVTFRDTEAGRRPGWQEVTAVGDGTVLRRSDVPTSSPSKRLSAYPEDLLSAPPDVRGARLTVSPGGPAAGRASDSEAAVGVVTRVADRFSNAFTGLVGHRLTVGWVLLALIIAMGLGAAHAVAPGHGKTMMAGYLLGRSKAGTRAAVTVATTVAVTHTAGVLLLAVLATVATTLAPSAVLPVLAMISGLLVLVVGAGLLRDEVRRRRSRQHEHHHHSHGHSHDHAHERAHGHDHLHPHPHGSDARNPGRRGLIGIGIAGGLVPSPSALVVLLGTTALGRAAYGVALVIAFGIGLASTLAVVGLLAARGGTALTRLSKSRLPDWPQRLLPLAGAGTVVAVGLALTLRGLVGSVAVL